MTSTEPMQAGSAVKEPERLAALDRYRILDTAPEQAFDDIVKLAAHICNVPMALISLVDEQRQWFKSALGLDVTETPRSIAFCDHAIRQRGLFIVENASEDARFATNPLVTGDPNLRFYAGAPLVTPEGFALGTLCVLDRRPRTLTAEQQDALATLSRNVMSQIELRNALRQARHTEEELGRAQEAGGVGLFTIDLDTNRLSGTPQFWRLYGLPEVSSVPTDFMNSVVIPEDQHIVSTGATRRSGAMSLEIEYRIRRADDGALRCIARKAEYERDAEGRPIRLLGVVRDVTEWRRVQQGADATEAQFRAFTGTLPNQVWAADATGRSDWFNDRVYEHSDLTREELDREGWLAMVHEEDRPRVQAQWLAAVSSGAAYEAEHRLRGAGGEYRWHLTRALPIRTPDGSISRWIGTNTDIHDRKRVENDAVRDRDRMWALSQEIMLVCDMHGRIVAVNPAASRILGHTSDEMVGRNIADFIHPDDLSLTEAELRRLAAGLSVSMESRYRTKDGGYRVLDWTAVPESGLVHAVARDITQEREASRDREQIWTSTNDLMATLDQEGRLKAVNPAWARLLGYDNSELLGRPLSDFILPEERSPLLEALEQLRTDRDVVSLEDHLLHKDSTQSLIVWSVESVGHLFYVIGRNITEQRATEDALRQSLKMEAVGQLTGGIAHDFNNLLQGIIGCLDLIRKRTASGKPQDAERFITAAMTSASRAAALTHRLLAFSRRQPLSPQPMEVNPLLTSMEDLMRRTLGEQVKLEMVIAGGLWLTKCDRNQLENALLNLVINARDAMPNGGTLTVETANVHLDRAYAARNLGIEPGQYVCVSVTDTGTGMSPDTISKAFEPFYTTKPIGRGTGLGLSMIYGFAKQSGGYAKIYSEVGKGTTVKLYLPRYLGDLKPKELIPAIEKPAARGDEVVLVVEDEAVVRTLIVEILKGLGYRTLEAEDGPSGLKMLESEQRIDLMVTDIGLPGLNGRQIVEAGRLLRPDLKVLFMTGYAENAVIASGFLEAGMAMITKPFEMDALATRIREMLNDG